MLVQRAPDPVVDHVDAGGDVIDAILVGQVQERGDEGRSDPPSPGRWIHAQIAEVPAALVVLDRGDAVQAPVSSAMPEPRQGPVRVHHVLPVDLGGPLRPQQRDLALVVVVERVGHGPGDDRGHTRLEGIDSLHTGRLPQRGRGSPHLETIAIGNPSGLRQRFTEAVRGHGDVIDHRRVDLPETGGPGVLDHGSRECHIHGGLGSPGGPASRKRLEVSWRTWSRPAQVPAVMGCDKRRPAAGRRSPVSSWRNADRPKGATSKVATTRWWTHLSPSR